MNKALHRQIQIEQSATQSSKDWTKHYTDKYRSKKIKKRQIKIEQNTTQSSKDWIKHYIDK